MKSFLILIFILFANVCYAQPCKDTTLKFTYTSPAHNLFLSAHHIDDYGTNFLFGYFTKPDTAFFLSKINKEGSVLFSRKIKFPFTPSLLNPGKILPLKNGRFLISVSIGTSTFESPDSMIRMIMFDNNGELLWSKHFFKNTFASASSLKECENGDIIMLYKSAFVEKNIFISSEALTRFNQNGEILWAKFYNDMGGSGESMCVNNNNIYVTSYVSPPFKNDSSRFEKNTYTYKFDALTGLQIRYKIYFGLKVQDNPNSFVTFFSNYAKLTTLNDGTMACSYYYENAQSTVKGVVKAQLDQNLNFTRATLFKTKNNLNNKIIVNEHNQASAYSENYESGFLKNLYYSKFDSGNNIIRELKLELPANELYQGNASNPIGLYKNYLNVSNNVKVGTQTILQLYQFPDDLKISECYGKDTDLSGQFNYEIKEAFDSIHPTGAGTNVEIKTFNFPIQISDLKLIATKECLILSSCTALKIPNQNDTICHISKPAFFTVNKNSECAKHVTFSITDTSVYEYMRTVNDTTVEVKFKKAYKGKIYASINSCGILKDSLDITVINTPDRIFLGNDTTLCEGESLLVNAGNDFKNYLWNDGNTKQQRSLQTAGIYSVIATDFCGEKFYDTISIRKYSIPNRVQLGNDTTLCKGQTITLTAPAGYKKYIWSDNSTNKQLIAKEPGKYFLTATDSCGNKKTATITIKFYKEIGPINLGANAVICSNKNYSITAPSGFKNYEWHDGSKSKSFTASTAGTYHITAKDSCGNVSRDTIELAPQNDEKLVVNYTGTICMNETALLKLPSNYSNYSIVPNSGVILEDNSLSLSPENNTLYNIQATNTQGCSIIDTLLIKIMRCPEEIYFASAFTPNNDRNNQFFKALINGNRPNFYELIIYNRFGQVIFKTNNINQGWDGLFNGVTQSPGGYVYICRYQFKNKPMAVLKGSFLLIR